ncbi:hypothetical protein [Halobaculum marinum]|uniref:SipW-cognate class signal peptide n=1 Tax=Halobaculum marinum TaxID=3031996 RepID=A0ABD5WZY3_9EURY|nr:hypothetical protein [Halobaculum sp. DT55]
MRHVTRREVLAGITAAGAAGAISGVGTAAMLADRETLAASVASGRVELRVDVGDGFADATAGPIAVPVPTLSPGDVESVDLTFLVPAESGVNPAYLWLRCDCAGPSGLGDDLLLTVSYASGAGETIFEGTYAEFLAELGGGVPLDPSGVAVAPGEQSCLDPGTAVPLTVEFELSSGYVGDDDATILLEGVAVQCRRVGATENPFAGTASLSNADCLSDSVDECDCCVRIGKYELDESNSLDAGTYAFTEGSSAYLLRVDDVDENGDGEAMAARFAVVLADDPTTVVAGCKTVLKAGNDDPYVYEGDDLDGVIGVGRNAISHVTVSICTPQIEGEDGEPTCPEDLVRDPSLRNGGGPSDDKPNNAGGNGGKR